MPSQLLFEDCAALPGDDSAGSRGFRYQYKKELAVAIAALLLLLTIVGASINVDARDLAQARKWAQQPWIESFCTVEDAGVAYRGNCDMDVTLVMTEYQDYAECMGPRSEGASVPMVHVAWEDTRAGRCARRGSSDFIASSAGVQAGPGDGHSQPSAPARRLDMPYRPQRLVCHNSYLPWAVVRLPNATTGESRCAYEFGAALPSITGDWQSVRDMLSHLRQARGVRGGILCWVLDADDCVVAFHDRRVLKHREMAEHGLIQTHVAICGALAVVLAAVAAHWYCQDWGLYPPPPGGYHTALPTTEPEEGARLSDHVQRIMNIAAHRLTDTTPPASGQSTLRVSPAEGNHRTVEVFLANGNRTTVSRNIAADFIETRG